MTKYEELKKVICEALPRLNQYKSGQILRNHSTYFTIIRQYQDGFFLIDMLKEVIIDEDEFSITGYSILGIDPTLSDVLLWIQNKEETDATLNSYGLWFTNDITWDLSKPLLKDQSEELIDYLLTLKK